MPSVNASSLAKEVLDATVGVFEKEIVFQCFRVLLAKMEIEIDSPMRTFEKILYQYKKAGRIRRIQKGIYERIN